VNDTSKYLSLFVSEATGHAEHLIRHGPTLLAGSFQADLVDELFRRAHSLRGMSAAMGFEELVALAKATEHLLGEMHGRPVRLSVSTGRMFAEAGALMREMIRARGDGGVAPNDPRLLAGLSQPLFEAKNLSPAVDP
jgi:two-component system, chemotaxis family, sensor kinase CheA